MERIYDICENKNDIENFQYDNDSKLSLIQESLKKSLLSPDIRVNRNNNEIYIVLLILLVSIILVSIIVLGTIYFLIIKI